MPLSEGIRTLISAIEIAGVGDEIRGDLQQILNIRTGDPYNELDISGARFRILDFYAGRGYTHIDVTIDRTIADKRAAIRFVVAEGKKVFIGRTVIAGNERTKYEAIKRELSLREGQPYSFRTLAQERQKLYKMGLFTDVAVDPVDATKDVTDILVHVTEGNAGVVDLGFGIADYEKFRGLVELDIVQKALSSGEQLAATEVIPGEYLDKVGLAQQARIEILDTPKAAPDLYDSREGTAGLVLASVSPIKDRNEKVFGAVLVMHLFNNDFTLVDRIKMVAGVDTVTIFLGDLRISTNVMTQEGERAIGTRVSQEVSDVVLNQGKEYVGPAFVVNENYITRYDPLINHADEKIGVLYVGIKQASFYRLVNIFNQRVMLVSIGMILFTFILTTPVSRAITQPLKQIRDLVEANRRVAEGDMSVRVSSKAGGDIGELTH